MAQRERRLNESIVEAKYLEEQELEAKIELRHTDRLYWETYSEVENFVGDLEIDPELKEELLIAEEANLELNKAYNTVFLSLSSSLGTNNKEEIVEKMNKQLQNSVSQAKNTSFPFDLKEITNELFLKRTHSKIDSGIVITDNEEKPNLFRTMR